MKLSQLMSAANIKIERNPTWKMCDKIELINSIKASIDYLEVGPTKKLSGSYYIGGFVYPYAYQEYEFCSDFGEYVSHICLVDQTNYEQWQNKNLPSGWNYPQINTRYFVIVAGLKYAMGMMEEKLTIKFNQGDLE